MTESANRHVLSLHIVGWGTELWLASDAVVLGHVFQPDSRDVLVLVSTPDDAAPPKAKRMVAGAARRSRSRSRQSAA